MTKPEVWWCMKWRGILFPHTVSVTRKQTQQVWDEGYGRLRNRGKAVRIRVEEAGRKK